MPISMSASANYVTQSGIYERQYLGRLTDHRIKHYQKKGYFATNLGDAPATTRRELAAQKQQRKAAQRQTAIKQLLDSLL